MRVNILLTTLRTYFARMRLNVLLAAFFTNFKFIHLITATIERPQQLDTSIPINNSSSYDLK